MLTFQNRALQDKAKRFEEALRKSADEQILVQFNYTLEQLLNKSNLTS